MRRHLPWMLLVLGAMIVIGVLRGRRAVRARHERLNAELAQAAHLRTRTSRLAVLRYVLREVRDAEHAYREAAGAFTDEYDALEVVDVPGVIVVILQASADSFVAMAEDIGRRTRCHVYWGAYPPGLELVDEGEGLVGCAEVESSPDPPF